MLHLFWGLIEDQSPKYGAKTLTARLLTDFSCVCKHLGASACVDAHEDPKTRLLIIQIEDLGINKGFWRSHVHLHMYVHARRVLVTCRVYNS